jgi:methyl-accepting chemotaxis protein
MKKILDDMRIMPKILITLTILGMVGVAVSILNARGLARLDDHYSDLITKQSPATMMMIRSNRLLIEDVQDGLAVLAYPVGSTAAREARADAQKAKEAALQMLRSAAELDPALSGHVASLSSRMEEIFDATERAMDLASTGQKDAAARTMIATQAATKALSKDMAAFNDGRIKRAEAESAEMQRSSNEESWTILITSIVASLVAGGICYWVTKFGIVGPLLAVEGRLQRLAGGDNTVEVPCTDRKDEVGRMCRAVRVLRDASLEKVRLAKEKERADAETVTVVATLSRNLDQLSQGDLTAAISEEFGEDYAILKTNFNTSMERLRELIGTVVTGTDQIRTGSSEIAQAAEDLARRTESTAASLEETSAAVTQMDGRLKATAGAATETVQRADQTIATVAGGRSVADDAVQAMGRVSESAKGIDSVIEGLDKIAFQTRVLAMNAAVEAGRAGEAGRGFAVVADLVSALAMRAEEEAKRARDQLTVTQTDIVTAVEAVEKVDGALQNISTDVGEVHQLLATIASDNQAQASAITEINAAIGSMDQATQQNAAMVEETSAAARSLLGEVTGLADASERFNLGAAAVRTRPAPRQAPAAVPAKPRQTAAYRSPVKPLPAAAIGALTRPDDDWKEF